MIVEKQWSQNAQCKFSYLALYSELIPWCGPVMFESISKLQLETNNPLLIYHCLRRCWNYGSHCRCQARPFLSIENIFIPFLKLSSFLNCEFESRIVLL